MVTDENGQQLPTILANKITTTTNKKGNTTTQTKTTCIALQPPNTNTITINNQDRKLNKVPLPEGEGCE